MLALQYGNANTLRAVLCDRCAVSSFRYASSARALYHLKEPAADATTAGADATHSRRWVVRWQAKTAW